MEFRARIKAWYDPFCQQRKTFLNAIVLPGKFKEANLREIKCRLPIMRVKV